MNWTKGFLIFSLIVFFTALIFAAVTFFQLRHPAELEVGDAGEVTPGTSFITRVHPMEVYKSRSSSSLDMDSVPEKSEDVEAASSDFFDAAELSSIDNEIEMLLDEINSVPSDVSRFPQVPEGYPIQPIWEKSSAKNHLSSEQLRDLELLDKALIALWNRGDHDFYGGILDTAGAKVYPHYPNTLYVRWTEVTDGDGETRRVVGGVSGGPDMADYYASLSEEERFELHMTGKFPLDIKILDKSTAGHDLYDLLSDFE